MGQSSSCILSTFHEVVSNRYVGRIWLFISRLSPFRNLARTQKAREKKPATLATFDILTGACITLFHPKKCDSPFSHFGSLFFFCSRPWEPCDVFQLSFFLPLCSRNTFMTFIIAEIEVYFPVSYILGTPLSCFHNHYNVL